MKTTTLTNNSYILGVFSPLVSCYESQLTWNMEPLEAGLVQRGPALRTLCPCVQVRLLVAAVPDMNSSLLLIVAALSPHS